MMMTARPRARSSPAAIATSLPKLREKEIAWMRLSRPFAARMMASVASAEPSSTNRISKADVISPSTGRSRRQSGNTFSASW